MAPARHVRGVPAPRGSLSHLLQAALPAPQDCPPSVLQVEAGRGTIVEEVSMNWIGRQSVTELVEI